MICILCDVDYGDDLIAYAPRQKEVRTADSLEEHIVNVVIIDKVNGAVSSFLTENICWVCKAKMVANRMLEDEKTIIQAAITEAITPSGVKEVVINKDGQVIITPQPIEFVEPIVQVEVIP